MAWASTTLAVPRGETDRLILADTVPPRIRVVHDPTTLRPASTLRRAFNSREVSTNEAVATGCCGLIIPPPRDGHPPRDRTSTAASLSVGSSGAVILRLAGSRRSRMSQACISGSPLHRLSPVFLGPVLVGTRRRPRAFYSPAVYSSRGLGPLSAPRSCRWFPNPRTTTLVPIPTAASMSCGNRTRPVVSISTSRAAEKISSA